MARPGGRSGRAVRLRGRGLTPSAAARSYDGPWPAICRYDPRASRVLPIVPGSARDPSEQPCKCSCGVRRYPAVPGTQPSRVSVHVGVPFSRASQMRPRLPTGRRRTFRICETHSSARPSLDCEAESAMTFAACGWPCGWPCIPRTSRTAGARPALRTAMARLARPSTEAPAPTSRRHQPPGSNRISARLAIDPARGAPAARPRFDSAVRAAEPHAGNVGGGSDKIYVRLPAALTQRRGLGQRRPTGATTFRRGRTRHAGPESGRADLDLITAVAVATLSEWPAIWWQAVGPISDGRPGPCRGDNPAGDGGCACVTSGGWRWPLRADGPLGGRSVDRGSIRSRGPLGDRKRQPSALVAGDGRLPDAAWRWRRRAGAGPEQPTVGPKRVVRRSNRAWTAAYGRMDRSRPAARRR
ncbi:uncharacterized protein V1510DRAFT_162753 [Dipodascopsis tothii]|uniref:uncharacterized protein n=1 Tax=Dipodascopsis tothii TaxID=44089 RepID=UPI0034CE1081